jgi:hypothetical protein
MNFTQQDRRNGDCYDDILVFRDRHPASTPQFSTNFFTQLIYDLVPDAGYFFIG